MNSSVPWHSVNTDENKQLQIHPRAKSMPGEMPCEITLDSIKLTAIELQSSNPALHPSPPDFNNGFHIPWLADRFSFESAGQLIEGDRRQRLSLTAFRAIDSRYETLAKQLVADPFVLARTTIPTHVASHRLAGFHHGWS
jgi:hypothetical protein